MHNRVPILHISGDVDLHAVGALRRQLIDLSLADCPFFVVDLSGVTFLDSTGLGVLVDARKRAAARGGILALVIDSGTLLRTFRISSLARLFAIHQTLEAAVSAAGDGRFATSPIT